MIDSITLENNTVELAEAIHKTMREQWSYQSRVSVSMIPFGLDTYGLVVRNSYNGLEKG